MPPPNKEETIARLGAEFDASEVIDGIRRMGTDWGKEMRRIEKKTEESMDGTGKAIKQAWWQVRGAKKAYKDLYASQSDSLRRISRDYEGILKQMGNADKEVRRIQSALDSIEMSPDVFEDMNKELERARENYDKMAEAAEKIADEREAAAESVEEIKEKFTFKPEEIGEALREAGSELWGPFGALINQDLPGAIEKGGHLAGKGWETLFKKTGKVSKNFAKFLAGDDTWKGMRKVFKERWAGGGVGGKAKAIGGAALGGMFKGMGEILGVVSKLGPLLMTVSTLVMGLVQMFIQADAAAKDFNKQVLSTAGTATFMAKNYGMAGAAAFDLKETLGELYKEATSFEMNQGFGISKDDFTATMNAMSAEGVEITKLGKKFDDATKIAKNWSQAVKTSVAYSRAFGVSLQEIGQFQGELMTELGMNLDEVQTSFQYMVRGAEKAGIATNKFFGIIRGFSSDLTLFTIRMEDVVKVMSHLGKAMSPRDAQKFMQNIMGFFKGQGLGERAKHVLMGGGAGATGGRLQAAMNDKIAEMATSLSQSTKEQITPDQMKDILKRDSKSLAGWIAAHGDDISDDQKKAIFEAARQQGKLAKGGLLDVASALKDADPFTAMEQMQAEIQRIASKQGKRIEDLTDIERLAAEQAVGVTDEMQDQFAKANAAVEQTRADLMHALDSGDELSKEQIDMLKKMGIDATKADAGDQLWNADQKKIWNSMSKDQQRELTEGKNQLDYQKEISENIVSVADRIKMLTDWFQRVFFQAFQSVSDFVSDILDHFDKDAAAKHSWQKVQSKVSKSHNQELIKAAQEASNSQEFIANYHKTKAAGQFFDAQMNAGTKVADLNRRESEAVDRAMKAKEGSAEKKRAQDQITQIRALKDVVIKNQDKARDAIADGFKAGGQGTDDMIAALKASGVQDQATADRMTSAFNTTHGDLKQAVQLAGLSNDQQAAVWEQLRIRLKPEELADATAKAVASFAPDQPKAMENLASGHTVAVKVTKMPPMDTTKGGAGGGAPALIASKMGTPDADDMEDQAETTNATLQDIYTALRFRGIVLDKAFLETSFREVVQKATYEAASEALGDYYVLTHTSQDEVLGAIQKGMDPKYLGREIGSSLKAGRGNVAGGTVSDVLLQRNAAGGMVTAVRDGLAVVRAPAGEGIAAVAPGERIGGGGGSQVVEVVFRGDAGKVFDARVQSVIAKDNTARTRR